MKKIVRLHFMSIKYHLKINNQNAFSFFMFCLVLKIFEALIRFGFFTETQTQTLHILLR